MSVPDDARRDAERAGELVRKKLLEIMDLQGDIDEVEQRLAGVYLSG